jgi:hypothetical protein
MPVSFCDLGIKRPGHPIEYTILPLPADVLEHVRSIVAPPCGSIGLSTVFTEQIYGHYRSPSAYADFADPEIPEEYWRKAPVTAYLHCAYDDEFQLGTSPENFTFPTSQDLPLQGIAVFFKSIENGLERRDVSTQQPLSPADRDRISKIVSRYCKRTLPPGKTTLRSVQGDEAVAAMMDAMKTGIRKPWER